MIDLSIVVPVHNEEKGIHAFFDCLIAVLSTLDCSYEIICVNDGSTDTTLSLLRGRQKIDDSVRIIDLSRCFGKEVALTAGLDYCRGKAVIPIDADLQDSPELIPQMMDKWREGFDVVYATRRRRSGETLLKRITAHLYYRLLDRISEVRIPLNAGDYRLLDRRVVEALRLLPERTRYMKGLFSWVGFKQTAIYFDRDARHAGESRWSYLQLWRLAVDGITSFSTIPLKIWSYFGLLLSLSALLYAAFLTVRVLVQGIDVPGYASMMVVILFLGGVQLITLGVLGEYLGRVFTEVKGRPLYLVRETIGFDSSQDILPATNKPQLRSVQQP